MVEILDNPHIRMAVALETRKDALVADLADRLLTTKAWADMTDNEWKICIRNIVTSVESEEELRERLGTLGVGSCAIDWHLAEHGDKTGDEARMLVKALGGLVAKNGALVMIMTADEQF